MVTRAAEYAKETSVQQRKNELMQDYLTVQARAVESKEKQKVAKTVETQETTVQLEKDAEGYGGGYEGSSGASAKEESESEQLLKQLIDTSEHAIDIKI